MVVTCLQLNLGVSQTTEAYTIIEVAMACARYMQLALTVAFVIGCGFAAMVIVCLQLN